MKKQVAFGFIALSILSALLSMTFASASLWSDAWETVKDPYNITNVINFQDNIFMQKILLFFLVFIVIFAISDYLPFFSGRSFLSFVFSAIVAILAIFFLKNADLSTILLSYNVLGLVLTAIIPFFIIAAISKKSYEKGHTILAKTLWVAFIVVLLIMSVTASITQPSVSTIGITVAYWIMTGLALLMLLFEKTLYFFMAKSEAKGNLTAAQQFAMAEIVGKIEELRDEQVHADEKTAAKLESRIAILEEKLKKYK